MTPTACATAVGLYAGDGIACAGANCPTVYTYGGAPVPVIDADCVTTNTYAEIIVNDNFTITNADAAFFITHTYQGDVKLTLVHVETATQAVIVNQPGVPATTFGFGADNYGASATVPFRSIDSAANIYDNPPVVAGGINNVSGLWKPEAALSIFNGQSSAGTWRLLFNDCAGGDVGNLESFKLSLRGPGGPAPCYANCDASTTAPVLNVADFTCFLTKYAAGTLPYANCDNSTTAPVLNVADFTCFLTKFAGGCP
jgi:subtilisin-like proprotein convertase family protein